MNPMDAVTRHAPQHCPICATRHDAAGALDGQPGAPVPGDWTICVGCLQWLVFLDGLRLRPVTDGEWLALDVETRQQLTAQREQVRRAWTPHE